MIQEEESDGNKRQEVRERGRLSSFFCVWRTCERFLKKPNHISTNEQFDWKSASLFLSFFYDTIYLYKEMKLHKGITPLIGDVSRENGVDKNSRIA